MAKYVDGFLIPLKKKNLAAYKKMAMAGKKAWMKYGALVLQPRQPFPVPLRG